MTRAFRAADCMTVHVGDITALAVGAVVNAANRELAGGGGVDGAIHRAAGYDKLQAACRKLGGCPTGEVRVTPGYNLPAAYIFHAVGPVWRGGEDNEAALLRSCYHNAMREAAGRGIESIAFPAISCGVYGYPLEKAVAIAVDTVLEFLEALAAGDRPPIQVTFCCFDQSMGNLYKNYLETVS